MRSQFCAKVCAMAATSVLGVAMVWCAEPPGDPVPQSTDASTSIGKPKDQELRLTVEAARERAKLMHDIYETTLDVMHQRFFRSDRSVLPARAMEDIFAAMAKQSTAQASWISVNTKAMSIHHEPKSEFEKLAAKELSAGKAEFELVEDGYYQRAGRIPLGSMCVACHTASFSSPTPVRVPKFAGLVIRIPVQDRSPQSRSD